MDAFDLNRRLAEALRLVHYVNTETGTPMVIASLEGGSAIFAPATSSDHLREYVYPEITKRELVDEFIFEVRIYTEGKWLWGTEASSWFSLTADPAGLAYAALKVLEAGS